MSGTELYDGEASAKNRSEHLWLTYIDIYILHRPVSTWEIQKSVGARDVVGAWNVTGARNVSGARNVAGRSGNPVCHCGSHFQMISLRFCSQMH